MRVACLPLGTQPEVSPLSATACLQRHRNYVVFYRGEDGCMCATRHATANVAFGCNFLLFVGGERAVACLSLGMQLQVSP